MTNQNRTNRAFHFANLAHFAHIAKLLIAISFFTMLTACGGGSAQNGGTSPASVQMNPDTLVVSWNTPGTLDVLSNDVVSSGKLSLISITGAAHGKAVIENNKISYTPDKDFFGTEKLTYSAKADAGGATAIADIMLTVHAQLTLKGAVSNGSLSNATITTAVEGKTYTATTDGSGNYTLTLLSSNPKSFLSLTAVGSAAQARIKLSSDVGELLQLAKSADATATINQAAVPGLGLSYISTAQQVLVARALGNKSPSNSEELRLGISQVSVGEQIDMATGIKLVAELGAALPSGISDTLALAQNPKALATLIASAKADPGNSFDRTRAKVAGEFPAAQGFSLNGLSEKTVYYSMYNNLDAALTVVYKSDGTGRINWFGQEEFMSWKAEGTSVRISYATPISWSATPLGLKLSALYLYSSKKLTQGLLITHLSGNLDSGFANYMEYASAQIEQGPEAGTSINLNGELNYFADVLSSNQALPINQSLFPVGRKFTFWKLPGSAYSVGSGNESPVTQVTGATQMKQDITSFSGSFSYPSYFEFSWKIADNRLLFDNKKQLSLLRSNLMTGEQLWSYEDIESRESGQMFMLAHDSPAPKMTEEFVRRIATWSGFILNADKTTSGKPGRWEISSEGYLLITSQELLNSTPVITIFEPIRKAGNIWWLVTTRKIMSTNGNWYKTHQILRVDD